MKKLLLLSLCFLMLCASQVIAQTRTVTGTVTSKDDGLPLPGVSVKVTGSSTGAQTNANGKFTLSVPASAKTLTFSFVGFEPQTLNIGPKGEFDAILSSSTRELTEVVVTAGGLTVTKGSQGYATSTVKPEQLTAGKAANVGSALSGKVAGLQINTVSAGVNPTVRVVLRGNRSLLGNNQALIVVDNNIVPNSFLGNINPEDVDDIQVLNGAGGAALYGSDASNGAIIITTKKGKKGAAVVRASQTFSAEHVSYFPKLQTQFGAGTQADVQEFLSTENQQFGPAFDGSLKIVGAPLADGTTQFYPYSYNNSKERFWQTGTNSQTDFSVQAGDDKSSTYVAGQYYVTNGVTPGDKYNRVSIRANGNRSLANHFSIGYTANYVQNRYDVTSNTGTMYDQLEQTPGNVDVTAYKDYLNNPFADVNGYYNFYYLNPYYQAAAFRSLTRNDILLGTVEAKYDPFSFLNFTFRTGITTTNQTTRTTAPKYNLTAYANSLASFGEGAGGVKTSPGVGSVSDGDQFDTRVVSDLFATFHKQIKDFNTNLTIGSQLRQDKHQEQNVQTTGLLVPDLYNVSARTQANVLGSESQTLSRSQAVYGVLNIGYKGFLNLHVTGRNDWTSLLPVNSRSFFYPAADVSFIPTEAIDFLKNNKVLSSLKIRAGISKVGNVNIAPYALLPTFGKDNNSGTAATTGSGYPYPSGPGYNQDNRIIALDLKPEITKGFEFGFDADLYNGRITGSATFYHTATTGQTVPISISNGTAFTSYLVNTGQVDNSGVETSLTVVPIKTTSGWQLTLGGNFTFNDNKVISLTADGSLPQLSIPGSTGIFAVPNQAYPVLEGADYVRDSQGRVIVNAKTGYPTLTSSTTNLLGSTVPKQRLGLNFELKYKTLRLSAVAEYRGNFIVQSAVGTSYDFSGSGYRSAYYNRERFVFPNSSISDGNGGYVANTNIVTADGGQSFWSSSSLNTSVTTNYVYNGATWRLREAALSWDVPKSLLGRQKAVKGATISIQGRNLILWLPKSNLYTDPEFNNTSSTDPNGNSIGVNSISQAPPTRYYGATLSLTF